MNEQTETGLTDEKALERLRNTATWLGKSEHIGDFRIWSGVLLDIHEYLKDRLQKGVNVIQISGGTHYHYYNESSAPVDIGDIEI